MTLQSSGTISLGNVNTELGNSSAANINMNNTDVRALANVASGAISMSNFYGKSYENAPGGLWAWGGNNPSRLGLGTTVSYSSPIQIGSDNTWTQIDCGQDFTIALKSDGTLWGWGSNQYGQLALNDSNSRTIPTQIGGSTWKKIASGWWSTIAIKTDGTMWIWGMDSASGVWRSSPTQVGSLSTWSSISAGPSGQDSYLAIKTDGTLWGWGFNGNALGLGDSSPPSTPTQVGSATNWSMVSTTAHAEGTYQPRSAGIKTDGTLWIWGTNNSGELGLGYSGTVSIPTQLGVASNWKFVTTGASRTFAIKTDGTLWAWGSNNNGALGLSDTTWRTSPTQVGTGTNWATVNAGYYKTFAIKTDGTLWAWGQNTNGELGLNNLTSISSPVQVGILTTWKKINTSISSTFAIRS